MSAAVMLLKQDAAHLLVDAACYPSTGLVHVFRDKCVELPGLHCAITTLGPYNAQDLVSDALQRSFNSFDDLVVGADQVLREMYATWDEDVSNTGRFATDVSMIGWSKARERAEAYNILLANDREYESLKAEANRDLPVNVVPFVLRRAEHLSANPMPKSDNLLDAGLKPGKVADLEPADMLRVMEAQRRIPFYRDGKRAFFGIGGYALLTTADRHGITQSKLHVWEDDQIGELIMPRPLELTAWCAEQAIRKGQWGEELSPLRRQMVERKAKKMARRAQVPNSCRLERHTGVMH